MPKYDYTADEYEERIDELEAQVTRLQKVAEVMRSHCYALDPDPEPEEWFRDALDQLHPSDLDPVKGDDDASRI